MDEVPERVRALPFAKTLDEERLRFLASCGRVVRVGDGALLLREGSAADALFILESGRVALEVHHPSRGTTVMERLGPGDVLGLSWLAPGRRWQLDARAVGEVEALVFEGARLAERMEADHDLGYALARYMLEQVVDRLQRVRMQRLDLYRAER